MRLLIPLFSPATGTWGGITRVVAIYEAACQAGCSVAFCASGTLADSLKQHGFPVYDTPPSTMLGLPRPLSRLIERRSQHVTLPVRPGKSVGSIWFVMMLSGMARAGYLKSLVEAQRAAVRDFRPDALFTDIDPAAFLTAAVEKLPISACYADILRQGIGSFAWKRMNAAVGPVLKASGLPARSIDELILSPDVLKIIPSIPELDGTDPTRPDVRYVGQLLGPVQPSKTGAFQPEPGKRYVFAYLGTGSLSLDRLREVLPLAFPAGGQTLCLVGAQSIQADEQIGGVRFSRYIPASEVLPHCDWVICHGGQNTIMQSLQHGVPLMIFPGPIFERRFNAAKVQEYGAGVMGELPDFKLEWLQSILRRQPEFAGQARVLGEKIHELGGAETAVQYIQEWVNNQQKRIQR